MEKRLFCREQTEMPSSSNPLNESSPGHIRLPSSINSWFKGDPPADLAVPYTSTSIPSPFKHVFAVVNPRAGKCTGESLWRHVLIQMQENPLFQSAEFSTHVTRERKDAFRICQSLPRDVDLVVALGGDGTLHEVVNGLFKGKYEKTPMVMPISAGTGSNLLYTCKSGWDQCSNAFKQKKGFQSVKLDVGEVCLGDELVYMVNVLCWGLAAEGANLSESLRGIGTLRYLISSLYTVLKPKWSSPGITVTLVDEGVQLNDEQFKLGFCMNNQHAGDHLPIAPFAQVDDGLMDLVYSGCDSRIRLLSFLNSCMHEGRHIFNSATRYAKESSLIVDSKHPIPVNIDGEPYGSTPFTIKVKKRAISLLLPKN